TGNKAYLSDYEDFNGGFVAFGSDPKGGSLGKDKGPTQEYILLPLQPHRTRILVKDVVQIAQEKTSKNASSGCCLLGNTNQKVKVLLSKRSKYC
ncbi:hypothetical protein Tco_0552587, partial [Tanacetum coccineum]